MTQPTFASLAWDGKGKVTRRERFLAEMDAVIPWGRLLGLIEPHYPKAGQGTQPMPLKTRCMTQRRCGVLRGSS
jgi:IS5 family transposase